MGRDGYLKATDPFVYIGEETPEEERYLKFQLSPGHRISGTVTDASGAPLQGIEVDVRREGDLPREGEEATEEAPAPAPAPAGLSSARRAPARALLARPSAARASDETPAPPRAVTCCASCHEKPTIGGSAGYYRNFFLSGRRFPDGAFVPGTSAGKSM